LGELCGSALAIRLAVIVPAAAIVAAAARWFGADAETIRGLRVTAALAVGGAAYGCFGASFRSQPAWVPAVLAMETAWHGAQLVASWLVLHAFAAGVPALLWIATMVQLLQIATALVMWRRAFGAGEPIRTSRVLIARTFRRAAPFAAAGIVANLQTRLAPLLLGYLSTEAELGAFAAAARFGTTARLAPGAIFAGALPVLSGEHERAAEGTDEAFVAFDRALAVLAVVTAVPCVVLARPLLRIVYGGAFVAAAPALVVIGLGLVPSLTNSAAKIALYAAGAETIATVWSAASLAIQVLLALVLMPRFGAVGGAAALALGEAAIAVPLRRARTAVRRRAPSSPHRAPAPTIARAQRAVRDARGPAAAR
jgi:O-antigen/teichoic acid export membrane protein